MEQEEEFARSDEAYDAITELLDNEDFKIGEILIAVGMIVAEIVREQELNKVDIIATISDVADDYIKAMTDA